MAETVTVELAPHLVASSAVGQPIDAWSEVASFFRNPQPMIVPVEGGACTFAVSADPSDVLEWLTLNTQLESGDSSAETRIAQRFEQRRSAGQHSTANDLIITVALPEPSGPLLSHALSAFLQKLFLTMNLVSPGSCSIGAPSFAGSDTSRYNGLYVDLIAAAAEHAAERSWPYLRRIPLDTVWEWLNLNSFDKVVLARTPLEKALLTTLRIAGGHSDPAYVILQIAQVFESMFAEGSQSISGLVRKRIEAILGVPTTHQNWFSKLYATRSRIVHGSEAIARPGSWFFDLPPIQDHIADAWPSLDQVVAVHLALLQDLVWHGASAFRFAEVLEYVPSRPANESS
jgi:hypothetical protein